MDFDREAVVASFLVETDEGLGLMEQSLLEMESNPGNPELLPNVFRVAHTLKGNATALGFTELSDALPLQPVVDGATEHRLRGGLAVEREDGGSVSLEQRGEPAREPGRVGRVTVHQDGAEFVAADPDQHVGRS